MERKSFLMGADIFLLVAIVGLVGATRTTSTLEKARLMGLHAADIQAEGDVLGLTCISETEGCADLVARAKQNPVLRTALFKAKAANITILPRSFPESSVGRIGAGYVTVNTTWHSDASIIKFLTQ